MIKTFFDLNAWKEGHRLVLLVYQTLKKFPKYETFGLSDQIRRCSVSMSMGSLTELQNQLTIAKDVRYIDDNQYDLLFEQTILVQKLIYGLMKTTFSHNT